MRDREGTRHSGGDPSGSRRGNRRRQKAPVHPGRRDRGASGRDLSGRRHRAGARVRAALHPAQGRRRHCGRRVQGLQDHAPGDRAEEQAGNAGVPAGRPVRPGSRQAVYHGAAAQLQRICLRHRPQQKGSRAACRKEGFGNHGLLKVLEDNQTGTVKNCAGFFILLYIADFRNMYQ